MLVEHPGDGAHTVAGQPGDVFDGHSVHLPVLCGSALDGAGRHTLDDIFLAGEIEDDYRNHCHDEGRHNRTHIHSAIGALHVLDHNGDGLVLVGIKHQIGKKKVVPYPHGLQYADGDVGRLHDRKHHGEEHSERGAAVDQSGLFDLNRDGLHEAAEHEDREPCTESQIDDDNAPGCVKAQAVCHQREGEHHHLEGDDHGEHAEQVNGLCDAVFHTGDEPRAHGGAYQDHEHRAHRDKNGPADSFQKAVLSHRGGVVVETREGALIRELKGFQVDEGLLLEGVEEHDDDGKNVEKAQKGEKACADIAQRFFSFRHCCTSLERVARS